MEMKLAAAIVMYEPSIHDLRVNIESFIEFADKLIVWLNSPLKNSDKEKLYQTSYKEKIITMGTGENVGIAAALNQAISWATANKYSHILTMDQDSNFEAGHLNKYINSIESCADDKTGIFCPNIKYRGNLVHNTENEIEKVKSASTAGSIYPLKIFKTTGLFREDLFIDAVDYEFCFRIKVYGYKTVAFTNIILNQKFGYSTKTQFGFSTLNYSPARTYYIIRNHIIIWRKYPHLYDCKKDLVRNHIILRIPKVILAESQKCKKLKAIWLGLRDGMIGKTGYRKV